MIRTSSAIVTKHQTTLHCSLSRVMQHFTVNLTLKSLFLPIAEVMCGFFFFLLLPIQRAGYSLQELFHLSRSQVIQQRTLALQVLGRIVQKVSHFPWNFSP